MKVVPLETPGIDLKGVQEQAEAGEDILLTSGGETRFAVIAADEADWEAFTLGGNADFLAYLDDIARRAAQRPRKSLRAVREVLGTE